MIKTKRLIIFPASKKEMENFILKQSDIVLKNAYNEMLNNAVLHPEQFEWYAIWMIELKNGTHVGELCFKGIDEYGSTEIGYGILENFQGYGYATEAVTAVTEWAIEQEIIKCITAEVDKDNKASIKVLEKSGYRFTGNIGNEGLIYKIEKK